MKAAVVDLDTGDLASERIRIPTPRPATPEAMAAVAAELVSRHGWTDALGVGFPGIVRHGVVHSAANLDASWVGIDADRVFTDACGVDVAMVNDADAAGLSEMRWGAGHDLAGVIVVLTFGTGIGSGLWRRVSSATSATSRCSSRRICSSSAVARPRQPTSGFR